MTLEEFKNADLRIAKVISAERVEGSQKLLKLIVDLGAELGGERQVVSGIGKAYEPEKLVGREVVMIVNLDPREIMGHESRGMILAAHGSDASPVLLQPFEDVEPGAAIT